MILVFAPRERRGKIMAELEAPPPWERTRLEAASPGNCECFDDALRTSAISELPASLRLNYDEIMWYNFQRDEWRHFLRENKVFGNIMENRYGCR